MLKVPDHIKSLPRFSLKKSVMKNNHPLINLAGNENFCAPFKDLLKKIDIFDQALNRYPDPNCVAIRTLLAEDVNGSMDNVIVGNGSEGILSYIFKAYCTADSEILTVNGTFVGVYILAQSFNIRCIKTRLTNHFEFDLDLLLATITEQTRVIYLSNPNNPTGCLIPHTDLIRFLAQVPSNILVILDEAYYEYAQLLEPDYGQIDYLGFTNLITLRTLSKAYGLANIRFGYGFAHKDIIDTLLKVKLTFEPSGMAQQIATMVKKQSPLMRPSLQLAVDSLTSYYHFFDSLGIHYIRSYANFVMIDLSSTELAATIYEQLLELNIRCSPLAPFGLPSCLRISMGSTAENAAFFDAFSLIFTNCNHELMENCTLEKAGV